VNEEKEGGNCNGVARAGSRLQGTRDWTGNRVGAGTGNPECWVGMNWTRERGSQVT
jgi:hypothetical protein